MRWGVLACLLALAGSFLVSYVRARAQSLGFKCDSGIFARPERVVVTVAGLVIGGSLGPPAASWVLVGVVGLLAGVAHFQGGGGGVVGGGRGGARGGARAGGRQGGKPKKKQPALGADTGHAPPDARINRHQPGHPLADAAAERPPPRP